MGSNVVLNFIQSFFGSAGLIVGLFALVGSILLRRSALKTVISTFTTILGFFILSLGGGAIGTAMIDFGNMFKVIVGTGGGTVGGSDAFAIALMNNATNIAAVTSIMLLLAILFNLLLAGTTRFKNIFLSTHIVMYFCVGFTVMFMLCAPNGYHDLALGKQGLLIALIGAGLISIYTTLAPSLTTKVTYELTKDKNMNLCHHGLFCFYMAQGIGKLCGKAQHGRYTSTEDMHLPRWMSFLKNSNVTIVLVMVLLFAVVFIAAYAKSPTEVHTYLIGGTINGMIVSASPTGASSLAVAFVIDAFMFTAGLLVLIEGITMMVNELRDCIKGISQRFITGAIMSVDASLVLKTQPIAVLLGFLASFLGAICTMGISFAFKALDGKTFSSIILPSVTIFFFLGGIAGIFGNMRGGLLGCLMAGFFVGLIVSLLPILLIATWNTLAPAPAPTSLIPNPAWYNNQNFDWTNNAIPSAVMNNSYGESDYILIPIFGWLMYGGEKIAGGSVGGINPMTFVMLGIMVAAWVGLIFDGQLKTRREKLVHPEIFYNHRLMNINDAQKHYEEVYAAKLLYISESEKVLLNKKNNYEENEYQKKLNRLAEHKQRAKAKYDKQKLRTNERLVKLENNKS